MLNKIKTIKKIKNNFKRKKIQILVGVTIVLQIKVK
jgi:hypothetical protein